MLVGTRLGPRMIPRNPRSPSLCESVLLTVLRLQPVAVSAEVQGPQLFGCLSDEIAFADQDLLSAVELDVLTTLAAERSPKLLTRCERFIHRASSREKAIFGSTPVEACTTPLLPG
jgi:hypothetical protein